MLNRWWWLAAAVGLVWMSCGLPAEAQEGGDGAVPIEILCGEDGTACREIFASVELPGGIAAQLTLSLPGAENLNQDSLMLSAELIDPNDAQLRARLPDGTFIPSDFPVLLRIDAAEESGLSFRGRWSLELVTENLEFSSRTPARLLRARNGGLFRDITLGLGSGSLRVFAGGDGFSEFVVAADLRPVEVVVAQKLNRLDAVLQAAAPLIPGVIADLQGLAEAVAAALAAGELVQALAGVNQLLVFVRENSGIEIPDLSRPGLQQDSVAGLLLSAGATLAHSLSLAVQSEQQGMTGVSIPVEIGDFSAEVSLRFEESFLIEVEDLGLSAEIIADVHDPAFLSRLPEGVHVPEQFPVLLRVSPDVGSDQAFSGMYEIELVTDSLSFLSGTPLRLFKAPDGGAFEDITLSLGLGSLRVFAGGDGFSEFVIAADQRPIAEIVTAKLDRLEGVFNNNSDAIAATVRPQIESLLAQLRQDVEAGRDAAAVAAIDQLAEVVRSNSGGDVPSLWRSDEALVNVAGALRSVAKTLRFSLELRNNPLDAEPGDVNRDGQVGVEDLLMLIDLVFGEP